MVKFNDNANWWDEKRRECLRVLWIRGQSASQIATIMKTSRNSVIGKARRMGLKPRPHPIRDRPIAVPIDNPTKEQEFRARRNKQQRDLVAMKKARKAAAAAGAPPPPPKEKPIAALKIKAPRIAMSDPSGPLTLEETQERNGCRWPSGHRPNMTFCGKTRDVDEDPATSYCHDHRVRSVGHQPLPRLRAA